MELDVHKRVVGVNHFFIGGLMEISSSPALPEIVRKAADFTSGYNVEVGVLPYGADVVHAAPPYKGNGWFDEQHVMYEFTFTQPATYKLYVEYAALDPRPSGLYWDGRLITTGSIGSSTGGWYDDKQKWEYQGIVAGLATSVHRLLIRRAGEPLPHLRTIRLILVSTAITPSDLRPIAESNYLQEIAQAAPRS